MPLKHKMMPVLATLALLSFLLTGLPYGKFNWTTLKSVFSQGGCPYGCTPTPPLCVSSATAPGLLNPAHRLHTTDSTPRFTWSNVSGAESYRLMVYTEDHAFTFKKRVFDNEYTLSGGEALARTKFLWRVRTQDSLCGTWTAWSGRNTLFVD